MAAATCAVASLLALGSALALSQDAGSAVTGNPRVDALLAQMTLAEKLTLIHDGREDPRAYQGQAGVGASSRDIRLRQIIDRRHLASP